MQPIFFFLAVTAAARSWSLFGRAKEGDCRDDPTFTAEIVYEDQPVAACDAIYSVSNGTKYDMTSCSSNNACNACQTKCIECRGKWPYDPETYNTCINEVDDDCAFDGSLRTLRNFKGCYFNGDETSNDGGDKTFEETTIHRNSYKLQYCGSMVKELQARVCGPDNDGIAFDVKYSLYKLELDCTAREVTEYSLRFNGYYVESALDADCSTLSTGLQTLGTSFCVNEGVGLATILEDGIIDVTSVISTQIVESVVFYMMPELYVGPVRQDIQILNYIEAGGCSSVSEEKPSSDSCIGKLDDDDKPILPTSFVDFYAWGGIWYRQLAYNDIPIDTPEESCDSKLFCTIEHLNQYGELWVTQFFGHTINDALVGGTLEGLCDIPAVACVNMGGTCSGYAGCDDPALITNPHISKTYSEDATDPDTCLYYNLGERVWTTSSTSTPEPTTDPATTTNPEDPGFSVSNERGAGASCMFVMAALLIYAARQ